MNFPFLLYVSLTGGEFYRLVWAIDYNAAAQKLFELFGTDAIIQNANVE